MAQYEKRFSVVDVKTGAVVYSSSRGFYPPRYDPERGYLFWPQKTFAKQFSEIPFPSDMTDTDIARMARLAKRIWSNSNVLVSGKTHGPKSPIDVDEMGVMLNASRRSVEEFLRKMNGLGVIAFSDVTLRGKTERFYYVNPLYFFSSNRLPLALYLMFREEINAYLPDWVKHEFGSQESAKARDGMSKEDILVEAFERGLRGKKEDGCELNEVAGE